MPHYVIFLGAAGSGKGTQAQEIKMTSQIVHLSTGDLLRSAMNSGSELGVLAKSYVESGNLVPDDLIINLVKSSLIESNAIDRGFILDGFPRTEAQAIALNVMLDELSIKLSSVVLFDLSLDDTISRIVGRRVCSLCQHVFHISNIGQSLDCSSCGSIGSLVHRSDDTEDKVRHRYSVFTSQTKPLIEFYQSNLYKLDATQIPDQITGELVRNVFS